MQISFWQCLEGVVEVAIITSSSKQNTTGLTSAPRSNEFSASYLLLRSHGRKENICTCYELLLADKHYKNRMLSGRNRLGRRFRILYWPDPDPDPASQKFETLEKFEYWIREKFKYRIRTERNLKTGFGSETIELGNESEKKG